MNGKRWQRTILLTIMAASLALSSAALPPAGAALAQSSLTVAVTPTFVDVIRGGTASYHLWVTGGENVNAIDLTITYDPALISEVSYTYGDYLDNIWRVYYVNEPGYFQISLVQLATPGVWGDGDLLNLNFITRANGITPITLEEVIFAAYGTGDKSYPDEISGALLIHSNTALTPNHDVIGTVIPQGQMSPGCVTVTLDYGLVHWFGPYPAISTGQLQNNLLFPQVEEDEYRITASAPGCLPLTIEANRIVSIHAAKTSLNPLYLRSGNAVWEDENGEPDLVIDALDLAVVCGMYGAAGAGLAGDVNFDGRVNIIDVTTVAGNYGLNHITAYADWIP